MTFLPFAQPDIDETEITAVTECLRSGWLTTGAVTRRFEAEFAAWLGASHAVAVNSATAAMHLALEAIGLRAGEVVITTPYTFAATAEVIRYFDAVPVFVDVEPDTLNIDPAQLAKVTEELNRQGKAVRAILPVHIAGHPCAMDAIHAIANQHGLAVIEDAAHALPTRFKGQLIGAPRAVTGEQRLDTVDPQPATRNSQHATCFSFYATKSLTTGEGGMLVTENPEIAERARLMSLHGISKDAWKRYTAEGSWYYEITAPGFKYNLTDIAASLGLAQLAKMERMAQRRCEIAQRYDAAFSQLAELQCPTARPGIGHAWHLYLLRIHPERIDIDRNEFLNEMKRRDIGCSVHFIPLHLHPYYRETYGYRPQDFPVAYSEYQRVFSLPIYSKMTDDDVQRVIEAVCDIVEEHRTN